MYICESVHVHVCVRVCVHSPVRALKGLQAPICVYAGVCPCVCVCVCFSVCVGMHASASGPTLMCVCVCVCVCAWTCCRDLTRMWLWGWRKDRHVSEFSLTTLNYSPVVTSCWTALFVDGCHIWKCDGIKIILSGLLLMTCQPCYRPGFRWLQSGGIKALETDSLFKTITNCVSHCRHILRTTWSICGPFGGFGALCCHIWRAVFRATHIMYKQNIFYVKFSLYYPLTTSEADSF